MADQDKWYYCLKHSDVESEEQLKSDATKDCTRADRLGPYPDQLSAARALDTVRERNETADREDADWDGD